MKVIAGENIRYVVPHEITLDEPVEFFMRVRRPDENVVVDVGGLRGVRQRSIRPSEMLSITVTPEMLKNVTGDSITIQVVSQKEAEVGA